MFHAALGHIDGFFFLQHHEACNRHRLNVLLCANRLWHVPPNRSYAVPPIAMDCSSLEINPGHGGLPKLQIDQPPAALPT